MKLKDALQSWGVLCQTWGYPAVKFQSQGKRLRCLFKVAKQTWPPGSIPFSPYQLQGVAGTPTFYSALQPLPYTARRFPYYPLRSFCTFGFLAVVLKFPSFPSLPTLHIWFRVMSTLNSPRCVCHWPCTHITVINTFSSTIHKSSSILFLSSSSLIQY